MLTTMTERTEDDHPWEYHETTSPVGSGSGLTDAPMPPGDGWQFVEQFQAGTIVVYRWKRPKRRTP